MTEIVTPFYFNGQVFSQGRGTGVTANANSEDDGD